jgi:hypothetical protein
LNSTVAHKTENNSWAIITPSYRGDFERCRLLCQSMDAFVTGEWHHYIIVETVDLALFKPLAGPRRTILEMEALLPRTFHHVTRIPIINNRSLWFSWGTRFMLGWHVQQLVKMEMAFQVQEDGLLYCDSDVFFVRPFDVAQLAENGQFRFYRTADSFQESDITNPRFSVASARHLGLKGKPFPCPTYVDNLVTWHRPTAQALCAHISQVSGRDWKVALGRDVIISEYTLYGLFAERILQDRSHLKTSHDILCKTVWHRGVVNDAELDDFCDSVTGPVVAIGVQSFTGIATDRLGQQLNRALIRAQKQG